MKTIKIALVASLTFSANLYAGWQDQLDGLVEKTKEINPVTQSDSNKTVSGLSNSDMSGALKEALAKGVKFAVTDLGKKGGYLNNPLVTIPLPKNMKTAEKLIRKVGGEKYVDDLILALNRAAEEAAPKTAEVFLNSIKNMSITDAKNILAGNDDAATQYFKTNSTNNLTTIVTPIVKKSMENNNIAKYYNSFQSFYKKKSGILQNDTVSSLTSKFGVDDYLPGQKDDNIESYVTNKSIEGLMTMIAKKEKEIRDNPIMRNSDLLKKVFGAF
ncbi:MAG: DUF4197 domain-containing protein [Gammaproteobacteria bacterium]|nr:DUF4197 domain-containing protein [Gammaproteobacteria bacterium]